MCDIARRTVADRGLYTGPLMSLGPYPPIDRGCLGAVGIGEERWPRWRGAARIGGSGLSPRLKVGFAAVAAALALAPAAYGQGAGDDQYQDPFGDEQEQATPVPTPRATAGALLLGAGLKLRAHLREPD
jgi:hypothetical protein